MRSMRRGWYGAVQALALLGAGAVVLAYRALGEWLALATLIVLVGLFAGAYAWQKRRARAARIQRTRSDAGQGR